MQCVQELQKSTGVFIPLFSIYSKRSVGIGDFEDLKLMIDWCSETENNILQLLPMNHSYNSIYAPFSFFAIDPVYIALDKLLGIDEKFLTDEIEQLRREFPVGTGYVDYRVQVAKVNLLYDVFSRQSSVEDGEFFHFVEENKHWLHDYALFMALKDEFSFKRWEEWEKPYRDHDTMELEIFEKKHKKLILFYKWMQWQLFVQFSDVKKYADAKNIKIMGDLFYMVARDSSDIWANREFFMMDYVSGLPQEPSHGKGQRWGDQPVYNWNRIIEDNFKFLKQRLDYNENFYNIMRLDHTPSFFRVWCIHKDEPWENLGMNGFFYPSTHKEWEERGRKILKFIIENSNIKFCAENLGPFTTFFTPVVREFGIPIINFQRWEKDWNNTNEYIKPEEYDFYTMIVLSNHDTSNFADWWENEAGSVEEEWFKLYCYYLKFDYNELVGKLFEKSELNSNRLIWKEDVNSVEELLKRVGRHQWQVEGLIKEYNSTFGEKQKIRKLITSEEEVTEKCNKDFVVSIMKSMINSNAVFCIHSIIDWLIAMGIINEEYNKYRFNLPGKFGGSNWSLTIPISLEELMNDIVCRKIKDIIKK
ncbi:4-alpha-glucanotransferase [Inconstantimicrobium mannanitabidum]|uniref:Uncharacterized protein n=1 Tax=Inconstantimicrobium mannanitabidum TaxID=1604901 RepID=A0ACB5RDL6_9CLOT|nr:4-alpha-glucanotransferase [Clostridium sp. TW13]GKX67357.1 hypothetical protein rsdtw13_26150 [Clostridium sp. TW13]